MSEEATSTVVRVVRLLQCVADIGGEISVKEFATRLSLPPSTVHRLLKLLMSQGLIEQRASTQRYRAGPRVVPDRVADHAPDRHRGDRAADPRRDARCLPRDLLFRAVSAGIAPFCRRRGGAFAASAGLSFRAADGAEGRLGRGRPLHAGLSSGGRGRARRWQRRGLARGKSAAEPQGHEGRAEGYPRTAAMPRRKARCFPKPSALRAWFSMPTAMSWARSASRCR